MPVWVTLLGYWRRAAVKYMFARGDTTYKGPVRMVEAISALGLRHVAMLFLRICFGPFMPACVEAGQGR